MGSDRANTVILYNMGAKNTKKYDPINDTKWLENPN